MKQRLHKIRPPATPRLSVTLSLTIAASMLAVLTGIVGNFASTTIPPLIKPYIPYSWLSLGIIVLLGVIVTVWQAWYASGQGQGANANPTPASIPAQHSNQTNTPAMQPTSQVSTPTPNALPTPTTAPALASISSSAHYHTCVLSYATKDEAFVRKLHADLQAQGVPCWLAEQDGKLGDKLRVEIYQAIRQLDKLILVLSQNAIESPWVEEEIDVALDREHQQPGTYLLFPLRLDESVFSSEKYWAITVRQRRIGDFRHWPQDAEYQQALQRLLRDLHV